MHDSKDQRLCGRHNQTISTSHPHKVLLKTLLSQCIEHVHTKLEAHLSEKRTWYEFVFNIVHANLPTGSPAQQVAKAVTCISLQAFILSSTSSTMTTYFNFNRHLASKVKHRALNAHSHIFHTTALKVVENCYKGHT